MNLEYRVINLETSKPQFIAAMDEVLLNNVGVNSPPTLIFHSWEPSVSISSNQRFSDVNFDVCKQKGYSVVRMKSGGRAVIHHPEDITYSLFVPNDDLPGKRIDPNFVYDLYCQKINEALRSLGLPTEIKNKNDVYVKGRKLSGNAQRITKDVTMQQGIVLYKMHDPFETLSLMNQQLYDSTHVTQLGNILTSVSSFNNGRIITREEVVKKLTESLVGQNHYLGKLSDSEINSARELMYH